MEGQISIFDILPPEENYDIQNMTTEDMARVVGNAIGYQFKPSGWEDKYEVKIKKLTLSIHKSYYLCDDRKEGSPFIGCGWSENTSGGGSPIDSVEDAIKYFKRVLEMSRKGRETKRREKE